MKKACLAVLVAMTVVGGVQAKEWKQVIRDKEMMLDILITMNKSGSHATRPQ